MSGAGAVAREGPNWDGSPTLFGAPGVPHQDVDLESHRSPTVPHAFSGREKRAANACHSHHFKYFK